MKVKKFRIHPRIPSVRKNLKGLLGTKDLSDELLLSLESDAPEFVKMLAPAAFYQTWTREEMPDAFKDVLDEAGFSKALSVSAVVATIGQAPEEDISQLLINGETTRANVLTAFGDECVDLAFQFIRKLLAGDAEQDDCEVGEPIFVSEEPLLSETLSALSADQEGVVAEPAGHVSPRFTRIALAAWLPVSRKKRQGSASKSKRR